MKKAYITPKTETLFLNIQQHILAVSDDSLLKTYQVDPNSEEDTIIEYSEYIL